jgi:hypothetical protein
MLAACVNLAPTLFVEEDLAIILGRGRISPELEHKFKDAVKIQETTELHQNCEVRLDYGQGPTINRFLRDQRYLSTVIQLTMLAYFHNRQQLGGAISQLMTERFQLGIEGASPGPGAESIVATIGTCLTGRDTVELSRTVFGRSSLTTSILLRISACHLRISWPLLIYFTLYKACPQIAGFQCLHRSDV